MSKKGSPTKTKNVSARVSGKNRQAETLLSRNVSAVSAVSAPKGKASKSVTVNKLESLPGSKNLQPWKHKVDLAEVLEELYQLTASCIIMPASALVASTLFTVLTYCYELFPKLPLLTVRSVFEGSGKSVVLTFLSFVCSNALYVLNTSVAFIYRSAKRWRIDSMMLDEIDSYLLKDDGFRGILNGSVDKYGSIGRCQADSHNAELHGAFGPKVLGMITMKGFPRTLLSRSILIQLQKKSRHQKIRKIDFDRDPELEKSCYEIRSKLLRWSIDNKKRLIEASVEDLEMDDRYNDAWRPLRTIAALAGNGWIEKANDSAIALVSNRYELDDAPKLRLLAALKEIFDDEQLPTARILVRLEKIKGLKKYDAISLAAELRDFGVHPKQIRIGTKTVKGYRLSDLRPVFEGYLNPLPPETSETPETIDDKNVSGRAFSAETQPKQKSPGNGKVRQKKVPEKLIALYNECALAVESVKELKQ